MIIQVDKEASITFATIEGPDCGDGYSGSSPEELAAHVGVPLLEIERPPDEIDPTPQTGFTYIYLDPGRICGISRQYGRYPRDPGDNSIQIRIYHLLNNSQIRLGTPPPATAEAEIFRPWACREHPAGDTSEYPIICDGEMHGFYVQVLLTYSIEESETIVSRIRVSD